MKKLIIVILIGLIGWQFIKDRINPEIFKETPKENPVKIVSYNWKRFTDKDIEWVYEVENTSSEDIELARIQITTYDINDNILSTDKRYIKLIPAFGTASGKGYVSRTGDEKRVAVRMTE